MIGNGPFLINHGAVPSLLE